ncbi:MAG: helix-turn-helix transcriptional regulator [Syntrophomonadaceae bacterium]|nr:helix-turn-helix transcriptional regulator [Syntrophomonadaceae bacterium]
MKERAKKKHQFDKAIAGDAIRRRREQLNLTRQQLAEMPEVGMDAGFLGEIERGNRQASIQTYYRLKQALGLNWEEMLGGILNVGQPSMVSDSQNDYLVDENVLLRVGIIKELDRMEPEELSFIRDAIRMIQKSLN